MQKPATTYLIYFKIIPPAKHSNYCNRGLKMSSQQGTAVYAVFNNPCCSVGLSACLKTCQICLVELETKINTQIETGSRLV